ncbi:trigger factor [Patescibacteria group bacterium]|nr:trigger factor [Patescibacteria group bacterium]
MNYELKNLPKSQVQIVVDISPDELKPYLEKAAVRLSKELKIDGFRPGKVPFDVLKEKIGEQEIYQEAAQLVVQKTYPEIIEKEKVVTVSSPKIELIKVAPGNPLTYKAIVPLLPKVTLGEYQKFKDKRKKVKVDEELVEKTLTDLRKMRVKEKLVDREIKKGDKAEIDFQIFMDRVPIEGGQGNKFPLNIGEGNFIPGFEDQLIGLRKNDEKKFKLTFPKEYYQKNLANKVADIEVKVLEVYQRDLPELNDQFAKSIGNKFDSLKHLKEDLQKNLLLEEEGKEDQRLEMAIMEEIIKKSEFAEIPEMLIEGELEKMIAELQAEIERRQLKFDDYLASINKSVDDLRYEFKDKAETRIKTALVTREIAKLENIKVGDEEVGGEIDKTLKLYPDNQDIQKNLKNPQYFSYLQNVMTNRKVLAFLTKQVNQD